MSIAKSTGEVQPFWQPHPATGQLAIFRAVPTADGGGFIVLDQQPAPQVAVQPMPVYPEPPPYFKKTVP